MLITLRVLGGGTLEESDITTSNCTLSGFEFNAGLATVVATPDDQGPVSISVVAGEFVDAVGNPNTDSNIYQWTNDSELKLVAGNVTKEAADAADGPWVGLGTVTNKKYVRFTIAFQENIYASNDGTNQITTAAALNGKSTVVGLTFDTTNSTQTGNTFTLVYSTDEGTGRSFTIGDVYDVLGNTLAFEGNPAPLPHTWEFDGEAPTEPNIFGIGGSEFTNEATTAITATSEGAVSMSYTLLRNGADANSKLSTTTSTVGNNFPVTITYGGDLEEASYTLTATATDAAGNESTPTQVIFTHDNIVPTITVSSGELSGDGHFLKHGLDATTGDSTITLSILLSETTNFATGNLEASHGTLGDVSGTGTDNEYTVDLDLSGVADDTEVDQHPCGSV